VKLIEVLRKEKINPDLIIFLGDSNSALVAAPLKKEGYRIGHIEAGMRSHDKRMLEEINRTVCDICSDFLFVYHDDYAKQLYNENIKNGVYIVGNTIVEICNQFKEEIFQRPKTKDFILMDIHRPENFKYKHRLENIIKFAQRCHQVTGLSVKMLNFKRTMSFIKSFEINMSDISVVELMSYKNYLKSQYDSLFMISDSVTAQEEPALLGTPVIVPRDFTERPQSVAANCSVMLNANNLSNSDACLRWALNKPKLDFNWMGDGKTSANILNILENNL
jgi:UDP-N-acetylglucosamine 2-epimerase (non-hydrolysing)